MATRRASSKKPVSGRVQFKASPESETVTVHVDRPGFRRLLRTLEQLAETGEDQRFERSGRRKGGNGSAEAGQAVNALVFRIDDDAAG